MRMRIALLSLAVCTLCATTAQAEMIVAIEVKGETTIDPDIIISTSGLEIGDELTAAVVREAVQQVYNTKLFDDVNIEREKEGGGAKIIIRVDESPSILKIEFRGNKKLKTDKLKELCELKEKWSAPPSAIFDGRMKIRDAYKEEGYHLVEITPEIREEDGGIQVKYSIDEGRPVKIRSVTVVGNYAFSGKRLERLMKNREKHWWPWSGKFNQEEFEGDPELVAEYYQNNGYPNCRIVETTVTPEEMWILQARKEVWKKENKEWIAIEIEIEEGEKFYFGDVEFEGNEVFDTERLTRGVQFKRLDCYSKSKLTKTMEHIYAIYSDKGYLYLNVDPVETITDSIVDIVYKLHEGEPARIHKIIIADNIKTHEKVIRRELTIFPGEIFSRAKLITSQRKIFNLGFFKNIELEHRQANSEGDIDLIIKVEEKEAGTASVGASYYPKYGFVGNLSLSAPNFRGQGEAVSLRFEKGKNIESMAAGFTKPWLFDTPLTAGLSLYHSYEGRYWYRMQRTGGDVRVSRPVPKLTYTKARASYRLENVKVRGVTDPVKMARIQQGLRSAISFGIVRDSRDNFLNPTVGTRNDVSIECSGGILGGQVHYHKEIFETSTYHKLGWKFVLGLRGRLGIINAYTSNSEVPLYERFVLGGIGPWGLRGYKDWTVGCEEEGTIIGGRFASLFTIETKIAFPNNIYPLLFFDAGNAWECLSKADLQDWKRAVGVGFRIEIPMMGLVGFDLGYRLDPTRRDPERGWEFHLQMGRMF